MRQSDYCVERLELVVGGDIHYREAGSALQWELIVVWYSRADGFRVLLNMFQPLTPAFQLILDNRHH